MIAFIGFLEFYSEIAGTHYMKGGVPGKYPSFAETGFDAVMPCVEINQCVGRSFLGDDAAVLCWLRRAARNRHRHAIEQASRRWRGGRRDDAARTRRKILISTQVMPVDLYDPAGLWGDMSAEKSKRGLAVEINNGRAAMLGIFGFMAASKVDGSVPALSFIKPYAGDYMQPFEGNFDLFA